MKKTIFYTLIFFFLFFPFSVFAQEEQEIPDFVPPQNEYYRGRVIEVLGTEVADDPLVPSFENVSQRVKIRLTSGPESGTEMELSFAPGTVGNNDNTLSVGDAVVVVKTTQLDETVYYINDRYRVRGILWLSLLFFVSVIAFAGWKGLRSIVGLAFSVIVIVWFIMPRILAGDNPFFVFLLGSLIIAFFSIYLGHGFNRRTSVALVSTIATIGLSVFIALFAVSRAQLFGLGTEEAFYLQIGDFGSINLKGLLLGGIIIGVLGVLDDITTAQSATVEQIFRANPKLPFAQLVRRGLAVGHEHVISLVNTLALAYIGASFPLLILFTQADAPLWVVFNSERVIEEVVRTLIGSSALIIAVPITTYCAAYVFSRFGVSEKTVEVERHDHSH